MDTRTFIINQYENLLSHAQYRDPYFDFMYFNQPDCKCIPNYYAHKSLYYTMKSK